VFGSPGCKARRFAIVVPDSPIFIYIAHAPSLLQPGNG
jgi:hypothetical protein